MSCGCQVSTATQTGGVTLPITASPQRSPIISARPVDGIPPQIGTPFAPATAAGQGGALAQNLAQASPPAAAPKKKTSGWLVAALAAGALVFL